MKLAVCEAPATLTVGDAGWNRLVDQTRSANPDLLLLNEMPFGTWVSAGAVRDDEVLETVQQHHRDAVAQLGELGVRTVLATHPAIEGGLSVNEAFVWTAASGQLPVHTKQFFPNEDGFYESRWFDRGERRFEVADVFGIGIGFLICTDVMFNEWARYYGRNGAHLICVPRATPTASTDRWKTMCSAAAIVSGCYVASSNRAGPGGSGLEFAGKGWIFGPTGQLIVETSPENPVAVAELDLALVCKTQGEYPCYVEELPGNEPNSRSA